MFFRRLFVGILSGSAALIAGCRGVRRPGGRFAIPRRPGRTRSTITTAPRSPTRIGRSKTPTAPATRPGSRPRTRSRSPSSKRFPSASAIRKRLTELWDYEKFSPAEHRGGPVLLHATTRACRTRACSITTDSLEAEPRVLLDPNTLSADGTVALAGTGSATTASCWPTAPPRRARTGTSGRSATSPPAKDLGDHLKWIKFSSAAWTPDGKGFFYGRFPEPKPGDDLKGANYYQKLYYHRLGTPADGGRPGLGRPEHKEWRAAPTSPTTAST